MGRVLPRCPRRWRVTASRSASYDRIHNAGAELAAISIDDDTRQSGMAQRWGLTHTAMISDPGGDTYLQPLGLFNPNERDVIALPGMLIIDPDGVEVYRYQGRDFADRTNNDDLLEALDALDLPQSNHHPGNPQPTYPPTFGASAAPRTSVPTSEETCSAPSRSAAD